MPSNEKASQDFRAAGWLAKELDFGLISGPDFDGEFRGADLEGDYRYCLARVWDVSLPLLGWILTNPSRAVLEDDPTVRKCRGFGKILGYGGVLMANVFPWISTDPKGLKKAKNPFGYRNGEAIHKVARLSSALIVGWGNAGRLHGACHSLLKCLEVLAPRPSCLRIARKSGMPEHPLYLPYSLRPIPYPGGLNAP